MNENAWCLLATILLAVAILVVGAKAQSHTLGIDKAALTEVTEGSYRLISRVPQQLAPLITTPLLPERCTFDGDPRGARGLYEVRFVFSCETALTADDEIALPWQREGAMLTVSWLGQEPVTRFARRQGGTINVRLEEYLAGSGTLWQAARRYLVLGVEHILDGIDHLFFVLALVIVVRSGWRLVKTITAFTVAHSITLGLATLGYVNFPPAPVEASIALSIVFLCVEIVHAHRGRRGLTYAYPWIVAFAFGLLHGFGFAGALSAIGLPPAEVPVALLFFNIGVEIGQLIFVAFVISGIWLLRRMRADWPAWVRLTPTYAMGTAATLWFLERATLIFVPV